MLRRLEKLTCSAYAHDGRKVFVGNQCASPAMSSCRYIPAGLLCLAQDLQKLAAAGLTDPACKGL